MTIKLIGMIFVLPMLAVQFGISLDPMSRIIMTSTNTAVGTILRLTENV